MPEYPPPGDETREFIRVAAILEDAGKPRKPRRRRWSSAAERAVAEALGPFEAHRTREVLTALADAGLLRENQ